MGTYYRLQHGISVVKLLCQVERRLAEPGVEDVSTCHSPLSVYATVVENHKFFELVWRRDDVKIAHPSPTLFVSQTGAHLCPACQLTSRLLPLMFTEACLGISFAANCLDAPRSLVVYRPC